MFGYFYIMSRVDLEQRLLGVLFVCAKKTDRDGVRVMLTCDTAKQEVPAGLTSWIVANPPAFSFPGGGREFVQNENSGKLLAPETREQTLQNEVNEEMGLLLSLEFLRTGELQKYPFLVGQKKDIIHQIGATTALYWFDCLENSQQKYLNSLQKQGKVVWLKLLDLVINWHFLQISQNLHEEQSSLIIRPHTYIAAFMWYIQFFANWSDEAIYKEVNKLNMKTRKFLESESIKLGVPIQNGAFHEDGKVLLPSDLDPGSADFLYSTSKKTNI